jgi:uncharacterized protein Usg
MNDFERQISGWRLTTAEILYHLPDHPSVLQTYVWQGLDLSPDHPMLHRFLAFWESNLEGRLHSVRVCSTGMIEPADVSVATSIGRVH